MFSALDLYSTDPTQHNITADWGLGGLSVDDLDRDLSGVLFIATLFLGSG